jgi:hypothetical protein
MGITSVSFRIFCEKFVEIFVSQGAPPVSTTLVVNLPPVPLVSMILVATLLPVSTTQAVNLPPVSTTPVAKMRTISDCLHLKVNLKKKCIYMLILLLKDVQTKYLNFSDLTALMG